MFPPVFSRSDIVRVANLLRRAGCVYAEEEADVLAASAADRVELTAMAIQRSRGVPLEHVVGWADFCGHRVDTPRGVFIPRRRTEYLAIEAAALAGAMGPRPVVVELCCGSGAIARTIRGRLPSAQVFATDVDPLAVRCARRNLGTDLVFEGDLFEGLPLHLGGRVDLFVANAPYVPSDELPFLPAEARLHEPLEALDGGPDGLAFHRRLAAGCRPWLSTGGTLLVETSEELATGTMEVFAASGLRTQLLTDEDTRATVVVGVNGDLRFSARRPTH